AVAIDEYDYTIQEISEKGDINVKGVLTKEGFTEPREKPQNLDALPWVSKVYKENLPIDKYYLPFVQRPYVSIFDSRGCLANCSFCLSPQTFTSHHADGSHFRVRYRSVDDTIAEIEWIKKNLRVREVFVDSDTFTDRTSIINGRLKDFCEKIRPLDIKWSCNVRGDASYETLKMLKDANCRLIVTGFESYNDAQLQAIQKGVTTKQYDSFAQNVRRADLKIQSCWIIGLPGETWESVENNMKFVLKTRPNNLQVAPAHALKGTSLYKWASENGYIGLPLFNKRGQQLPQISQPQFSAEDTSKAIDMMYRRYFLSFGCLKTVLRDFITGGAGERERIIRDVKEFSKDSLQRLATQTLNNEISNR
ncbi:MAG: radical SAM protein, partial [Patescibacteria group bacterium]|nr:radical SAM protein [Patescibacteria group bacterium]